MGHPEFPSDETLAAFIDGRADPETRKRVIEHMVGCNDCYATFLAATEMRQRSAERVVPFPRQRVAVIAFAAAAIAAFAVLFTPMLRDWLRPKSALARLAAAAPSQRNIEGRLAGFPYRPLAPLVRGPGDTTTDNLKLLSAAAEIQEEAKKNPTPANLHALGVAQLLIGKQDQAVMTLEKAVKTEAAESDILKAIQKSTDAPLLNDLSAAYAARAAGQSSPPENRRVFEAAYRAWQLSRSAESAWNRAVALERLKYPRGAREAAWNDYLKIDSISEWANEARDSLKKIAIEGSASLEDSNCRQEWQSATNRLLNDWPPPAEARSKLAAAAIRLQQNCGDSFVAEVLRNREMSTTASACAALREAASKEQIAGGSAARDAFDRAARAASRSPLIALVNLRRSAAAFQEQKFEESIRWSRAALSAPGVKRFKVAEAQAYWMLGLSLFASGDPVGARRAYRRAWTTFADLHDYASEARVCGLLAGAEETIGSIDEAWALRLHAIDVLSHTKGSDYSLFIFASAAANEGLFGTARELLDEYLSHPETIAPANRADAYCLRALIDSRTTSRLHAEDLATARRLVATLPGKAERDRLQGYIALVQGMSTRDVRDIDAALQYYQTGNSPFVISRLLYWRGIAEARSDKLEAAQDDLTRSVTLIEGQGPSFHAIEEKLPFVGTTTDLFDALIDVQVRRHRYDDAFQYRERSRALLLASGTQRPFSLQSIAENTPPAALRVEYAVLPEQLVTWVIGHNFTRTFMTSIANNALDDLVVKARSTRDDGLRSPALIRLSSLLLANVPIAPQTQTVTFVPDKSLASVPFASLLFRDSFLIEHCNVALSTGLSLLTHRGERANFDSVVAFGNPTVPTTFDKELPPLPAAEREAREVASGFHAAKLLTGDRATVESFRRLSPQADVVHFAGHAIQDAKNPLNSALVFATPAGDSLALLPARELSRLPYSRTSLVVFSACATGAGGAVGVSNVAQACLLAGTPNVIASRDAVADRIATEFFRAFYSNLRQCADVPTALREAQRSFLRSNDPELRRPSAWDTFVHFTTSG